MYFLYLYELFGTCINYFKLWMLTLKPTFNSCDWKLNKCKMITLNDNYKNYKWNTIWPVCTDETICYIFISNNHFEYKWKSEQYKHVYQFARTCQRIMCVCGLPLDECHEYVRVEKWKHTSSWIPYRITTKREDQLTISAPGEITTNKSRSDNSAWKANN